MIACSNPAGVMDVCVLCVLSGRVLCYGLISPPGVPTECGVAECKRDATIMKGPCPTRGCYTMVEIFFLVLMNKFTVTLLFHVL
jgi:hypothetical protein